MTNESNTYSRKDSMLFGLIVPKGVGWLLVVGCWLLVVRIFDGLSCFVLESMI